jgi:CDGSH-type Zn-finger protein
MTFRVLAVDARGYGKTRLHVVAKNDVRLTAYRDGPLLVRAPATEGESALVAPGPRRAVALCRCGKSRLWPTCDGTHKLVGFRAPAADLTVPQSE